MKSFRKTNLVLMLLVLSFLIGCKDKNQSIQTLDEVVNVLSSEEDLYRPNFHFTPKKAWMNDPNGMFYYNGYYHLYFQYHPDSNVWGPMHWGHAISTDMITWVEQPIALYPDELGTIFSGSAVVDIGNTSGFGKASEASPIVAMYTSSKKLEGDDNWKQTQSIAYSNDEGKTFTKYENNPAIDNNEIKDFRDPKVTWDEDRKKWVMVLAAGDKIMFYDSKDLKKWHLLSDFGQGIGGHGGVWECPDLFQLPVLGTDESKWVLFVSINPGGPNGGSATQYFVGDFDGTTFKMDKDFETALNKEHNYWIDFGRDNYAGVSWSNATKKDGSKLILGWMSNWDYAQVVPTETWRSAMTIARKVQLQKNNNGYRLLINPVNELTNYRSTKYKKESITIKGDTKIIDSNAMDLASTEIQFNISNLKHEGFTFNLTNKQGDTLAFGYNHSDKNFFIDRRKSGKRDFSEKFADRVSMAKRTSLNTGLTGTIILDKTSIELFFDNGETVMTEIFFPNAPYDKLSIEPNNQEFVLDDIEAHKLNFN
ncbi:glycoside hydrolase family 32 protein [Mariniflexile litorale]|uniref:Glycoside hydrolase family 32 protein n=1 Tax=Mariniflexile litorale TaxID=3045158 RepID=A0AAU7EEP7_9FLAO|nr:glycoside hydrolase family 32 protein [Mariniflexile sp. KMM 9835]MDQ8211647.1 glycoside hydrolase family 32 protein [Mariniflexile sp. KMM 9835]